VRFVHLSAPPELAALAAAVEEYHREASSAELGFLGGEALAEIHAVLAGRSPGTASSGSGRAEPVVLPLNLPGHAVLAVVDPGPPVRCCRVQVIGGGRFVHGADNAVFGRWNALAAVSRTGRLLGIVRGHGGEIIPGSLVDHLACLREYVRTGRRRPVQLDIDVSMACTSACTFCFSAGYRSSRRSGLVMRSSLLLELVDGWADYGVRVVRFDGGGDPLTHPRLLDAIGAATRRGLRTAVLTAGDQLRETHLRPLLASRTYLRLSLNGGDDAARLAIHRPRAPRYGIRGPLALVRRLADMRAVEYGSQGRALMPLGATSMLVPANAHDTYAIAEQARRAGFDHLSYRVVLGADHAVSYPPAMRDELARQLARVRADLVDNEFQVFMPSRPLTDAGYRPAQYFRTCLACTHRALVEVGPDSRTAALVPCGRYRGHGFRWRPDRSDLTVLGLLTSAASIDQVWRSPSMARLVRGFPDNCADCIDRSANVFLNGVAEVLCSDPAAEFFRYHDPAGSAQ
jgi:MoaA/NifB/PqqE/SkfB family radical SAM enzyme